MPELNIDATTTPTVVTDYTTPSLQTEGVNEAGETWIDYPEFTKWYGNYRKIAKIKMAINAYATWVVGQCWTADSDLVSELEDIRGWGEDTLLSILWNMLVIKKVNGDAFAEVMRDPETGSIVNLKPLDPSTMRTVLDKQGIILRYEQRAKTGDSKEIQEFEPNEILHMVNDRVADQARGTSSIEAVEWNVEASEEAKRAHRKMVKRNGIVRVIEVDTEDTAKINAFKVQWKKAIEDGDVLILPKDVAEAKDWHGSLDTQGVIQWLNYLDDEFFQMIGIPKIIVGGSGQIEGDSKISYITFEQIYKREINGLLADLKSQLGITITFNLPASIKQ